MVKASMIILFTLFSLSPTSVSSQETVYRGYKEIQVVDDHEDGIESELFQLDCENKLIRIGRTDEKGYEKVFVFCRQGDRIRAKPMSANFLLKAEECNEKNFQKIKCTKIEIYQIMAANAAHFEEKGDLPEASMLYSDLAARGKDSQPDSASEASVKALKLFGEYLSVKKPVVFDPAQNKMVMSKEMKGSIKKFQKDMSIKVTGNLDYKTLSKAANADIGAYMFQKAVN